MGRRSLAAVCVLVALTGVAAEEAGSDVRVALVTDIGGLNDRGFNALANEGLERAEEELGVEGRVFISEAASDYVPNLSRAARDGYTIQAVVDGSFEGGGDTLYDVANDGVGYGEVSPDAPDRDALIAELDAVSAQIADGEIDILRK